MSEKQQEQAPEEQKKDLNLADPGAKSASLGPTADLNFMYDVPLNVGVELGRTQITLRNLLRVQKGTVIELNKLAGEPLETYLNNRLVARGEVVVVNEKYGIRLTDIVSHPDMKEQKN